MLKEGMENVPVALGPKTYLWDIEFCVAPFTKLNLWELPVAKILKSARLGIVKAGRLAWLEVSVTVKFRTSEVLREVLSTVAEILKVAAYKLNTLVK